MSRRSPLGCLSGIIGNLLVMAGIVAIVSTILQSGSTLPKRPALPEFPSLIALTPPKPSGGFSLAALGSLPEDARSGQFQLPFAKGQCYRVSQGNNGAYSHHTPANRYSWDFSMKIGTPVAAAAAGRVVSVPQAQEGSKSLVIDHGGGRYTLYAHLSQLKARPGERVRAGQVIAWSGTDPGLLPHLHYSVVTLAGGAISLPSRLVDDRVDRDGVPRQRSTYCAKGGLEKRQNPETTLAATAFLGQGIRLDTATPAHAITIGQSYRIAGISDRPLRPVHYEVRSATGEVLASRQTLSGVDGHFDLDVRVDQGNVGQRVQQVLFSDPNHQGSAISALLTTP